MNLMKINNITKCKNIVNPNTLKTKVKNRQKDFVQIKQISYDISNRAEKIYKYHKMEAHYKKYYLLTNKFIKECNRDDLPIIGYLIGLFSPFPLGCVAGLTIGEVIKRIVKLINK